MNNPYKSPQSGVSSNSSVSEMQHLRSAHLSYSQWTCLGLALCLILAFTGMGGFLIWQAIQLGQADTMLPPRLAQSDGANSAAWGSWILGTTSLLAAAANLFAIRSARHKQILSSAGLIAASIAAVTVVAIIYKP
jgi:hypothetical protein